MRLPCFLPEKFCRMIFFPYLCTAIERDCAFKGPLEVRKKTRKVLRIRKVSRIRTVVGEIRDSGSCRNAEIAQLVEHNLAKVGVASSSLVFRSMPRGSKNDPLFFCSVCVGLYDRALRDHGSIRKTIW